MEYFDLIYACNKVHTAEQLKLLQAMPLWAKVEATKIRLLEFYNHFNSDVFISFSGGKDSTVLAYIANEILKLDIPLVFSNTGLEYMEIQKFAKENGAKFVRPEMRFDQVITTYGYPLISKEVSEAIYYARRIRNGGNIKTTERKRNNFCQTDDKIKQSYKDFRRNSLSVNASNIFGSNSMFNKTKWLPACQELPFKISHYCCQKMKKTPLKKYAHSIKNIQL